MLHTVESWRQRYNKLLEQPNIVNGNLPLFSRNAYLCTDKRQIMGRIATVWSFLGRYKYLLVVVLGVLIVGVLDENSFVKRIEYMLHIRNLKSQIQYYETKYETDSQQLKALSDDPRTVERIARGQYMMKADDEEIFVLSDDEKKPQEDETAE